MQYSDNFKYFILPHCHVKKLLKYYLLFYNCYGNQINK